MSVLSSELRLSARPVEAAAVHARGVTKRFGDFLAIDKLDLEVRRGECVGLLGPNGAG